MATKKKKPDGSAFIKKVVKSVINHNTVLPILEDVYLSKDQLTVTDLEKSVVIPFKSGIEACVPAALFLDILDMLEGPKFKCDKNFGITVTQPGKSREIKLMGETPDNFPVLINTKEEADDFVHIGDIGEKELELLATALKFVSSDDLRPAMTGIYFDDHIVSTDAHRLYWHPIEPVMENFILPAKSAKVLLGLGGTNWQVFGNPGWETNEDGTRKMKRPTKRVKQLPEMFSLKLDGEDEPPTYFKGNEKELRAHYEKYCDWMGSFEKYCNRRVDVIHDPTEEVEMDVPDMDKPEAPVPVGVREVVFLNDEGIMMVARVIDARFPKYEVVIPDLKDYSAEATIDPAMLKEELKLAMKFANRSTNQVSFTLNGEITINSQDVDFSFEYKNTFDKELASVKFVKEEVAPMTIAFNGKFLQELLSITGDDSFRMKLYSPTKAGIINDHFLIMPLILNQ